MGLRRSILARAPSTTRFQRILSVLGARARACDSCWLLKGKLQLSPVEDSSSLFLALGPVRATKEKKSKRNINKCGLFFREENTSGSRSHTYRSEKLFTSAVD